MLVHAIITVHDKRTSSNINTRSKFFKDCTDINDTIEWARKIKNRVSNNFVIIIDGVYYRKSF